ncbi:MAG TPA: SRPBCC family protein [Solirubrobacteraceae bacterium]
MTADIHAEASSVRITIVVEAPIERAFRVFTEDFDKIKPREHNMLGVEIAETVFEPRAGGRIFDRGVDGTEFQWARVLAVDPPNAVVFSWDLDPNWQVEPDPARTSEVEVRFTAESPQRTRVELEHRNLDRHGDGWEGEHDALGGSGGWPLYLERFGALIAAED